MRILITGAAGLLGAAVSLALPESAVVRAVDLAFSDPLPPSLQRVELMPGDLRNQEFVSQAVQ
ncbi:MAG: NAD-dependent dehydratase, partial [Caldilineaceae bacterium]